MRKTFELPTPQGTLRGQITEPEKIVSVLLCLHGSPNGDFHGHTGLFDQLAKSAEPFGFATIHFSFYGSAPSDGTAAESSIRSQSADFLSVLEYVRITYPHPIHIVGESAGATIAAMNWQNDVKSYVLLWPALDLKDTDLRPFLTSEWLSVVERDGFLESDGVTIGKELFEELLLTDFNPCFKIPDIRTLIMHGRSDQEVPYHQSLRAVAEAIGDVTFVTVSTAGHGFQEHRKIVIGAVLEWLREI